MFKTRRAVIAVNQLEAGDRIQIGTELLTLTEEPRRVAGGDRWQFNYTGTTGPCAREYFEDHVTILVPPLREWTAEEVDAEHEYALAIHQLMNFGSVGYKARARSAWINGWTEDPKVPTDEIGRVYRGAPHPGQFILVPNAGGSNQSPGSYGYTRTEVIAVEHNGNVSQGFGFSKRIKTRAFGYSAWVSADWQHLICGSEEEAYA